MSLVPIGVATHGVELDLVYAGEHNFTGAPVYRRADGYLHPSAEAALREAVRLAAALGLRLRVYDAFRPTEAQAALWAHTPDPEFLAPPQRGSAHSRGVALDLTLVDAQGSPLDMGTDFDAFVAESHHGVTGIPTEAQRNRLLLLGLMTAAGWTHNPREWWHYNLPDPYRFPLLSDCVLGDHGLMR